MRKFRDKKTKVIYSVVTPSLADYFENNSLYEEITEKTKKSEEQNKKTKKTEEQNSDENPQGEQPTE